MVTCHNIPQKLQMLQFVQHDNSKPSQVIRISYGYRVEIIAAVG